MASSADGGATIVASAGATAFRTNPGVSLVPLKGLLSARPTAVYTGQSYLATDSAGGTPYECLDGSTWTQVAGAISTAGSLQPNVTAVKTSAYLAVSGDVVRVDASGGAVTVTVPVAAGTSVKVKNVGATGTVTVAMASGTIDGAATVSLASQWSVARIIADGTNGGSY